MYTPKDMWIDALGQILVGKPLEQYSAHADFYSGKYDGLKQVLLQLCGFGPNDNLNSIISLFNISKFASYTSWVKEFS